MKKIFAFFKREPVLSISAICMVISSFFVPPSAQYLDYIDFRVLVLLFCLMSVVAGLQRCGLFDLIAGKMLSGQKNRRILFLLLILLPFFFSMLVTNDVALITFVPFSILILTMTGQEDYLIFVIVMQTVAANLGSMATPVGNPQNLYLYSRFSLTPGEFFAAVLPFALLSLPLLGSSVFLCPKQDLSVSLPDKGKSVSHDISGEKTGCLCTHTAHLILYMLLFLLCLLSVFHLLPYQILLAIICIALFVADRSLFRSMDYGLILTFICFFIFAGNIGSINGIRLFLQTLLEKQPLLTAALASQVISNVPAAVLLSGFSQDWKALLLGTDLGGLGTPIASLASLISFRLYMKTPKAKASKFLIFFSVINFGGLALMLAIARFFG